MLDVAYKCVMGVALLYIAYNDLMYHKIDSYFLPVSMLICSLIYSLINYGFGIGFIMGFVIPFLVAYLSQLITIIKFKHSNPGEDLSKYPIVLGGLDIIIIPVCTSVFGPYIISYLILLFIPMTITKIKPVRSAIMGIYKGDYSNDCPYKQVFPLVPLLIIPFLFNLFFTVLLR